MEQSLAGQIQMAGLTGSSHGSPERGPRWLSGPLLNFDLAQEIEQMRHEATWEQHGHDAKTLVKEQSFRVVLIALKEGAALGEHTAPGPLAIQVLRGQVQIMAVDRTVSLSVGQLVVLEANLLHAVKALEESEFLLTIAGAGYGGPGPAVG